MKHPPKIPVPRYQFNPYLDRVITSMAMMRWLVEPFIRYYGRQPLITEQMLIACLELQRRSTGRVRAYILDPLRGYERILVHYTNYIETTIGHNSLPVAVFGPTKKEPRMPDGMSTRNVKLFSGRRPDHIRGFGVIRAGIMVCSDRMTVHSNRDRVGRRSMLALTSAVPDLPGTSLIFVGYSYAGRSRLFSQMYRRISGFPFPSDIGAKWTPRPEGIIAIDVRYLMPPMDYGEPDDTGPDTTDHELPQLDAPCTKFNNPRTRHHRRNRVMATL